MATSASNILQQALSLGESDRAEIAGALLRSLDEPAETGVEEAWHAEIDRRARELESGAVKSIPWEVVRERMVRARRGQ